MPTTFYPSSLRSAFVPTNWRGSWDSTPTNSLPRFGSVLDIYKLEGSNLQSAVSETNVSSGFKAANARFISRKLAAQTISGTVDIIIGALESNVAADFYTKIYIYVSEGDTDTVRGVLLDYAENSGTGTEWPTTSTGIALASAQTLSSVNAQEGDKIVVEIGYTSFNAVTTSRTGTIRYGCNGGNGFNEQADLALAGTDTSDKAGSITFSGTIILSANEPTNVNPANAIEIVTTPYVSATIPISSNDIPTYWKRTIISSDNQSFGAFAGVDNPTGNYSPFIDLLHDVAGVITLTTFNSFKFVPFQYGPATLGEILYFRVLSEDNDPTTRNLIFSAKSGLPLNGTQPAMQGFIVIANDDSSSSFNLPAVIVDTTPPGSAYSSKYIVSSEDGAVTDNGLVGFTSTVNGANENDLYIYDSSLNELFVVDTGVPSTGGPVAATVTTDGTYFYTCQFTSVGNQSTVHKVNQSGVIVQSWTVPNPASWIASNKRVAAIAVNRAGTIIYMTCGFIQFPTVNVPIAVYDLVNEVFLTDLYTPPTDYGFTDIYIPSDDLIYVLETKATPYLGDNFILQLDTSGTVLQTFTLTPTRPSELIHHLAPDFEDSLYFWIWVQYEDTDPDAQEGSTVRHEFIKVQISDFSTVVTLTGVKPETNDGLGQYAGQENAPLDNEFFGVQQSCPLVVLGERGTPIPPTPPPSLRSGIYKIVPDKREDTLWTENFEGTEDVKIPEPFAKLGYLG